MAATSSHRIVCVTTKHPHRHIVTVGTGISPDAWLTQWAVADVVYAIREGSRFYTVSPSTGKVADVRVDNCRIDGCTVVTLRSAPDGIGDNNLDNMPSCA